MGVKTLTTRAIVIAAGARPLVPPIPGIEEVDYCTSDTVWSLRELPKRLLVLGGGPIGSELAQCFARFGSAVTQVEMLPRILPREDPDISEMVAQRFRAEGIAVLAGHAAKRFLVDNGEKVLIAEHEGQKVRIPFDRATGGPAPGNAPGSTYQLQLGPSSDHSFQAGGGKTQGGALESAGGGLYSFTVIRGGNIVGQWSCAVGEEGDF